MLLSHLIESLIESTDEFELEEFDPDEVYKAWLTPELDFIDTEGMSHLNYLVRTGVGKKLGIPHDVDELRDSEADEIMDMARHKGWMDIVIADETLWYREPTDRVSNKQMMALARFAKKHNLELEYDKDDSFM